MSKKEGGEGKVGGNGETFEDEDIWAQFRKSGRWYATTLGTSHEGMRVAETEGGRRELEVPSMMVYQAVGEEVERVCWRRQRARLCREIYAEVRWG